MAYLHNSRQPHKEKITKLGKAPETPISDLVEEANRVFLNRDQEEEQKGSP